MFILQSENSNNLDINQNVPIYIRRDYTVLLVPFVDSLNKFTFGLNMFINIYFLTAYKNIDNYVDF